MEERDEFVKVHKQKPFSNLSVGAERFEPFYRSSTSAKTIIVKILQFVKGISGELLLPGFFGPG